MKASICSGFRRWSLLRSVALRSGLATISLIRSRLNVAVLDVDGMVLTQALKPNRSIPHSVVPAMAFGFTRFIDCFMVAALSILAVRQCIADT
jgi:hypothetical protein